jgi:hypothetical protein
VVCIEGRLPLERRYALVELSGWLYLGLKPLRLLIVSVREGLRASYLGVIEGTFRVVSYAYAVQVLSWVPLLNVLVGLYGLYLCV